jgi:GWxTD domain-containing protein
MHFSKSFAFGLLLLAATALFYSCTSSEELLSRKQRLVYVDSAYTYNFEQQYKNYFSEKTQKEVDQGLYFLLQTSLKQEKRYAVAATRMFYAYLSEAVVKPQSSATINFVLSAAKASMENDERKRFEDLSSTEEQLRYLVSFWGGLDPDPTTIANEALLVFGRRLAYSLNNFEPLGFEGRMDDRSIHVMKYGLPTVRREVRFNLSDLNTWLSRVYGASNDVDRVDPSDPIIERTVLMVRMNFPNPSIEVWVYDKLSAEEKQTLFFFGRKQGGEFAKLNSPEEIIPPILMRNAITRSPSGVSATLNPAAALIASIYSELPPVHPLINERLMSLQQAIDGGGYQGPRKSMNIARTERAITAGELRRSHSKLAAVELMEGEQIAIPTYSHSFRFINENGEAENLFYAYSNPIPAVIGPAAKSIDDIERDVQLIHSLETVDENGVSSSPLTESPSITIIPNPRASGFYPVQSVFSLKADSLQAEKIRFRAMLKQLKAPKGAPIDALTGLIGYGLNEYDLPEPLKIEEGKPQISDVIFGYKIDEVDALAESSRYSVPFWVPEVAELPLGLDLSLYFEVYNLQGEEPSFVLNYNLQKAGNIGILRDMKSRSEVRSVFLAQGKTHKMDLTIELADLEEGRYNLELEITDRANTETVKRDIEFVVIDAEKRLKDQSKKLQKRLGIKN